MSSQALREFLAFAPFLLLAPAVAVVRTSTPAPNTSPQAQAGKSNKPATFSGTVGQFLHAAHLFCERGGGIREGRGSPDLCGTDVVATAVAAGGAAGGGAGMYRAGGGIREGGDA